MLAPDSISQLTGKVRGLETVKHLVRLCRHLPSLEKRDKMYTETADDVADGTLMASEDFSSDVCLSVHGLSQSCVRMHHIVRACFGKYKSVTVTPLENEITVTCVSVVY